MGIFDSTQLALQWELLWIDVHVLSTGFTPRSNSAYYLGRSNGQEGSYEGFSSIAICYRFSQFCCHIADFTEFVRFFVHEIPLR